MMYLLRKYDAKLCSMMHSHCSHDVMFAHAAKLHIISPRNIINEVYIICNSKHHSKKEALADASASFLVTRRRFELRTPCLKGRCSAD